MTRARKRCSERESGTCEIEFVYFLPHSMVCRDSSRNEPRLTRGMLSQPTTSSRTTPCPEQTRRAAIPTQFGPSPRAALFSSPRAQTRPSSSGIPPPALSLRRPSPSAPSPSFPSPSIRTLFLNTFSPTRSTLSSLAIPSPVNSKLRSNSHPVSADIRNSNSILTFVATQAIRGPSQSHPSNRSISPFLDRSRGKRLSSSSRRKSRLSETRFTRMHQLSKDEVDSDYACNTSVVAYNLWSNR